MDRITKLRPTVGPCSTVLLYQVVFRKPSIVVAAAGSVEVSSF